MEKLLNSCTLWIHNLKRQSNDGQGLRCFRSSCPVSDLGHLSLNTLSTLCWRLVNDEINYRMPLKEIFLLLRGIHWYL